MQIMPRRFDGDLSPAFGKGQTSRKCREGRFVGACRPASMSAFGGEADIGPIRWEFQLLTLSGHTPHRAKSTRMTPWSLVDRQC
jgi:hypothetical protein